MTSPVESGCPGGAEYGHGFSRTVVHGGGCCDRWLEELERGLAEVGYHALCIHGPGSPDACGHPDCVAIWNSRYVLLLRRNKRWWDERGGHPETPTDVEEF